MQPLLNKDDESASMNGRRNSHLQNIHTEEITNREGYHPHQHDESTVTPPENLRGKINI
jgi:hypothetical protein